MFDWTYIAGTITKIETDGLFVLLYIERAGISPVQVQCLPNPNYQVGNWVEIPRSDIQEWRWVR